MTHHISHHDRPLLGMACMCAGLMFVPLIDVTAKLLSDDLSSGETAWWRFAIQLIMLPPVLWFLRAWKWDKNIVLWQILAGVFAALETTLFFHALQYMSMAKSIIIFFIEPMVVTILAAIFLGEVIRTRRIIAIIVGFIGAGIVVRPQGFSADWFVVLPVVSATCYALFFLILRRISKHAHPLMTLWMVSWGAVLTLSILLQLPRLGLQTEIFAIHGISRDHVPFILFLGLVAIVGNGLIINASSHAPASLLSPLAYVELVSAATFGYWLFDERIDFYTFVGGMIIISSGLYLIYREHQLRKKVSMSDVATPIN